jgi:hypothetical protein
VYLPFASGGLAAAEYVPPETLDLSVSTGLPLACDPPYTRTVTVLEFPKPLLARPANVGWPLTVEFAAGLVMLTTGAPLENWSVSETTAVTHEALYVTLESWTFSPIVEPGCTGTVDEAELAPPELPWAKIAFPLVTAHANPQPDPGFACVMLPLTDTFPATGEIHASVTVPSCGGSIAKPPAGTPPIVDPVVFLARNPVPPSPQPDSPPSMFVENARLPKAPE